MRLWHDWTITCKLQQGCMTITPNTLKAHIERRIENGGYGGQMIYLRVEFERANTSSLGLVVIADFDRVLADLCNRLQRSIQRRCVEACREYHWKIPFAQLTLHLTESVS